eukprot:CAMPEP_0183382040 /NCGR_PEP_ID=MMETSP0164_2-20130417/126743_1 /TAXON_ID=221442 /ORGANISM="Coccolithus pelagicus ssp braarudi, Strain PLY182g" /LENGTH=100 /DNA_ID=CAMNT_0025559651 /DNA_START=233 /DNA_END=536 /DNA_ORIENTATION=+
MAPSGPPGGSARLAVAGRRRAFSERIVEDVTRYPLVIDKIVKYKGGLVPDFAAQHEGCSRRERKATDPSRMYVPTPEVATLASERRKALREEAVSMSKLE